MAIDPADGRPWILLPGTLCSGRVFGAFLDGLAVPETARQPIIMRHPGVGDYMPELTSLCVPGAIICGFSLGAIVAAHLTDRLPADAYLLFGLNPQADRSDKRDGRLSLAREVARIGGAKAMASRMPVLSGPGPSAARALILDMADETAGHIEAQTELALKRPGALSALARTQAPIGLFTGTQDTAAPLASAEAATRAAPSARLVPLHGLGHYALVEDPAACCRAVKQVFTQF
ncbi:alpha/beta fold hydrolase [Devosia neptuniae]|uniref:alpha/beta fold hydrolase n=1 Tax=Devosia neptuniae TaxID=191302 RepID=UPI0022AF811A|nr:alpha/beta hydrolase [Devosia neptuniae]MCZ4348156.1 alpha/beta hydrolase [Devosia neptuniae]